MNDDALAIMEKNEAMFLKWKTSDGYTVFKELFVTNTDAFQRWFNINRSRRLFVALRPFLLEAQHQYLLAFFPIMDLFFLSLSPPHPKTMEIFLSDSSRKDLRVVSKASGV